MHEPSDTELMVQVKQGDVAKLALLFERYQRRLHGFCYRMTGDAPLADDLVQEVFFRVLRSRETFRGDAEFSTWVFQMARNACIDHFRRHRKEEAMPEDDFLDSTPATDPLALEDLERAESLERVRAALARLPLTGREVLVLSRFHDMRYDQIAELLGCSVGAVKLRVHRAVQQLRAIYLDLAHEVSP